MLAGSEMLSDADYEALADLRYTIRKFRQFSAKAAEKLGLQPQQHQALLAIKGLEAGRQMSMAMLEERMFLNPAATAVLAASLEALGYVAIEVRRGRRSVLRLTDRGEELLRRLSPAHLHEIREMAPVLMQALRVLQDRRRMEVAAWMQ